MIHKFILGRCVQCNLPQGDLERVGWECHGHVKSVSKTAAFTPLTEAPRVSSVNDGGSQDEPSQEALNKEAPSQGATNQETPVQAVTSQEVNSHEQVTTSSSDSTRLSAKESEMRLRKGHWPIIVATCVVILIFIAGIALFQGGPLIRTVAESEGVLVYKELNTEEQIRNELRNDITLNVVEKQCRESAYPGLLRSIVSGLGRDAFNKAQERYIQAGLVARVPEYSRVSLKHGFVNSDGCKMVKLEVLDGPSAGFHGYAYDVANAFRDVVQEDAAKLEKQLAEVANARTADRSSSIDLLEKESKDVRASLQSARSTMAIYSRAIEVHKTLDAKENEVTALERRYLPKHPQMIAATADLKQLQERFISEFEVARKSAIDKSHWELAGKEMPDRLTHPDEYLRSARQQLLARIGVLESKIESSTSVFNSMLIRIQETSEQAAREQVVRDKEKIARGQEQETSEQKDREQETREQAAREREQISREQEQKDREQKDREREAREQETREQDAQRAATSRRLAIDEEIRNEVNRAEDLLRLSCISGGQSLDELKYGFDWKYPKQVHAAIDSALADRLKQLANDPKRLAEFKTTYEKLKSIRCLAIQKEEEYQRKRALNPDQYPMKYRTGNYDPICFETWKKSQEHKQSSEQLSGVPKALSVETAPTGKQTTGLGDEKGKPGTDEIVLFEEHFTKSGNSPDPRLQSNMCFLFKGDKKYQFKRDKGLFPTEKGITLQFRWNAPKSNMPKSWEPGTGEPGAVILQVDVYDVSGSRIMYQPQVKASLDWQDVNVPIMVPFNAESILIWNKWEDVEMYVDDVKIVTTAPAPSEIQAADLITAFLKHGEEPNIQTELADYADTVNPYFDQGQLTKAAILKDITEYRTKWPTRSLQLIAIESARLVRMNILEATYRLRYSASNGKQNRSGALIQEIRFTLADQKWLVSGIRTVRQVADVDQHQSEAFTTKEKKAASLVTAFLKHSESPDAQIELADYADIVDPYFYSKRQTKAAILKDITAYRAKWPKISLQLIDIDSVSSDRDDILNVTCRLRYSASNGLRNRSGTLVQRICFTQTDKRWLISGVEIVQRMNSDGKVQDAEQSDAQQRQGGPPPQIRLGDVLEFFGRWGER